MGLRELATLDEGLRYSPNLLETEGNLKRVNFSGRTVIGPDPLVPITHVVVPLDMAKKLTVPVRVNEINIERMKELLEQDKINYILRESEEGSEKIRYNMKYATYTQGTRIQYGDIVIRDGQQIDGGLVANLRPGDKLIRDGIEVKDVQFPMRKAFNIQIGDIAEKILEDNESVVINRQPTQTCN